MKMSSMLFPKKSDIAKASSKDGLYFPVSIELIVCLETLRAFAKSSWFMLKDFRNSSTLFSKKITS